MPTTLQLYPSLSELTYDQTQAHIEEKRARRMVAAITYYQGKNARYENISAKLKKRLLAQYELLGKELVALDKALSKAEQRANTIEQLKQSEQMASDMVVTLADDVEE